MAADPVDPRFRAIAKPVFLKPPPIAAEGGISRSAAATANAFFTVAAQSIGYGRALSTSLNRAQGAAKAKNTAWEKKQMLTAADYAVRVATLYDRMASLLPGLGKAAASMPLKASTAEQLKAFRESVVKNTLARPIATAFRALKMTKDERNVFRYKALRAQPAWYAKWLMGTPAQLLTTGACPRDPACRFVPKGSYLSAAATLRNTASALRNFARHARAHPLEPA